MSPHSDYHQYARMGAASGLTPNPFRKRVTLTASERTKKLEAQTLHHVLKKSTPLFRGVYTNQSFLRWSYHHAINKFYTFDLRGNDLE